jgi:thiamine pyrophosphokinase
MTTDAITFVGGATASMAEIEVSLTRAPRLIAVDGGADTVLNAGLCPEAVVGDMDSISPAARSAFADRLHPIEEQDSTDFAKALRAFPAPFAIAVGFVGARVDHFLACLSEMARSGAPVVLLSGEDCVCLAPSRLSLDLLPGTRVSLWPLARSAGRSTGLRWPIDGLVFAPAGRVGTSNMATGAVTLAIEAGPMALILPAAALDRLLLGLGWWSGETGVKAASGRP